MIGPFEGKFGFLSNFHVFKNPIYRDVYLRGTWQQVPFFHTEGPYQIFKCQSEVTHQFFFEYAGENLRWPPVCLPPNETKQMGKKVFLRADWEEVRVNLMTGLVEDKFFANIDIAEALLATGVEPICELNYWHDNFWGNCTCAKCKDIPGQNWLGRILMHTRWQLHYMRSRLSAVEEVRYVFRA